jgi:hypothetical protein
MLLDGHGFLDVRSICFSLDLLSTALTGQNTQSQLQMNRAATENGSLYSFKRDKVDKEIAPLRA